MTSILVTKVPVVIYISDDLKTNAQIILKQLQTRLRNSNIELRISIIVEDKKSMTLQDLLLKNPPDMWITDNDMAYSGQGIKLANILRERNIGIPIFLQTGNPIDTKDADVFFGVCTEKVLKPAHYEVIIKHVKQIAEQKLKEDEALAKIISAIYISPLESSAQSIAPTPSPSPSPSTASVSSNTSSGSIFSSPSIIAIRSKSVPPETNLPPSTADEEKAKKATHTMKNGNNHKKEERTTTEPGT